jgi:hypothetical protein
MLGLPVLAGADPVMPLPEEDRQRLDDGLGRGVVGKAVPAPTIKDPAAFLGARNRSWTFRITDGDKMEEMETHTFSEFKEDSAGKTWKFAAGANSVSYLRTTNDGSMLLVSDEDRKEGVITRYSPPQPVWVANLKPGDVKRMRIDVKVYDLTDPKEVSHKGYFNMTYTYVGAYEVTVPAGRFNASLLKWEYKGEIGPASVEDVQYRFLAKGVGPTAVIEKLDVSAFLLYQNHTKCGMVLTEAVEKGAVLKPPAPRPETLPRRQGDPGSEP